MTLEQTKQYFLDCPSYPTARAYAYAAMDAYETREIATEELDYILRELQRWLQGTKSPDNIGGSNER